MLSNVDEVFSRIQGHLDQLETAREEILQKSRMIIRKCSAAIKELHRGQHSGSRQLLNEISTELHALQEMLEKQPDLNQMGNYLQTVEQEYAEASLFLAFMEKKTRLPTPSELKVSVSNYLNGMADFIGELRRYCLNQLKMGNLGDAERAFIVMEEIFDYMMSIDAANAILPGLRRKLDSNRGTISRTREDLARARMMESFLEQFRQLTDKKKKLE